MENLNVTEDKQRIREERKIRNKQKRELRKNEKQKERDKLDLMYNVRPQGSNVSLITRQFANYATGTQETKTFEVNGPNLTKTDFPLIGEVHKKIDSNKNENVIPKTSLKQETKKTRSSINVNILDLFNQDKHVPTTAAIATKSIVNNYIGNRLDSSMPERKRGKHKEINDVKKPNKFKTAIKEDQLQVPSDEGGYYPRFIYYDNEINVELENSTKIFLSKLVTLQEKLFKRNPLKGQIKKRYIIGFHEIKKYLKVCKIKILIIATDIKVTNENDTLHCAIKEVTDVAKNQEIDYFFALKRRQLGSITLKHMPVSCIGIINYEGAQDEYKLVQDEVKTSRENYTKGTNVEQIESKSCLVENLISDLKV